MLQATELPNNNSSIQVTTLASGELALVYNAMSAAAVERRASLYDEIDDGDDEAAKNRQPSDAPLSGVPHARR